jgi:hemerythrin-like metal-binding protein
MTAIQWSDELSVNIPSIDNQHKTLIKLINRLDDAINAGNTRHVLQVVLGELTRYTEAHFIYEEALFDMYGYPGSPGHKKAHKKLFEKVEQFKQALARDEDIYQELAGFLNEWLYHHILREDMAYAQHLLNKGAE